VRFRDFFTLQKRRNRRPEPPAFIDEQLERLFGVKVARGNPARLVFDGIDKARSVPKPGHTSEQLHFAVLCSFCSIHDLEIACFWL
jgi:hypothetical protein